MNKNTMKFGYEKERVIRENIDSMVIVKSYNVEEHRKYKFDSMAFAWELANIYEKNFRMTTEVIFNTISSTIRPGILIYYINMIHKEGKPAEKGVVGLLLDAVTELLKSVKFTVDLLQDTKIELEMSKDILPMVMKTGEATKIAIHSFEDSIKFSNIYYTAKEKLIIENSSFEFKKGGKYAIYGRNGAGKSSIIKVMMGFEDYKGSILVNGINLNDIDMNYYRKLITYVPQDTRLFNHTVFFNLSFGNDKSYDEVIREAKRMKIHDFIMALPDGYNTVVGDFGNNINGGLRQKIYYTRAFLCDREIYVFDEPTNNLDEENSKFLLEYINDPAFKEKTFIVICHNHEIVNQFPGIYKFGEGKVVLEKNPFDFVEFK